jgi:hypothetical protein
LPSLNMRLLIVDDRALSPITLDSPGLLGHVKRELEALT